MMAYKEENDWFEHKMDHEASLEYELKYELNEYFKEGLLSWKLENSKLNFTVTYNHAVELAYDYLQIHRLQKACSVEFVVYLDKNANIILHLPSQQKCATVKEDTPFAKVGFCVY